MLREEGGAAAYEVERLASHSRRGYPILWRCSFLCIVSVSLACTGRAELAEALSHGELAVIVASDGNGNGHFEEYTISEGPEKLLEVFDLNDDGRMDRFVYYIGGVVHVVVEDRDYDGRADWWERWQPSGHGSISSDDDFNGVVDRTEAGRRGEL